MFLKRLIKSEVVATSSSQKQDSTATNKSVNHGPPHGMQTMGAFLQNKFGRGINYNMKIIIRGDRNVGKTCLHLRLQGQKFREEYLPTDEIQVASIQWNYKTSDDIIKVEVWDVVDKGRKKRKIEGLKLEQQAVPDETCLDAEFVDVYKGTHGVIMVLDITKQWTFDYVEKEVPKIPSGTPILILANHRDMGHHRTVSEDQVKTFVESMQEMREGSIQYAESSMRNGFGLKYIHKFFNLPFLHLQRLTLLSQLEKNREDIDVTLEELEMLQQTDDQNYQLFSETINNKRRELQDKLAQKAIEDAKQQQQLQQQLQQQQMNNERSGNNYNKVGGVMNNNNMTKSSSFSTNPVQATLREAPPAHPIPGLNLPSTTKSTTKSSSSNPQLSLTPSKSAPSTPAQEESSGGFLGKFLSSKRSSSRNIAAAGGSDGRGSVGVTIGDGLHSKTAANTAPKSSKSPALQNVDEFRPDGDDINNGFLDDEEDNSDRNRKSNREKQLTDSDDNDDTSTTNPLVAGFQDDFNSSEDEKSDDTRKRCTSATVSRNKTFQHNSIELSDDDDGADGSLNLSENRTFKSEANSKSVNNSKDDAWGKKNSKTKSIDVMTTQQNSSSPKSTPQKSPTKSSTTKPTMTSTSTTTTSSTASTNKLTKPTKLDGNTKKDVHSNLSGDDDDDDDDDDGLRNNKNTLDISDDAEDDSCDVNSKNTDSNVVTNAKSLPPISFNASDIDALEEMFMKKTKLTGEASPTTASNSVVAAAAVDVASTSTDDDLGRKKKKKKKKRRDYNSDDEDDDGNEVNSDTENSKTSPKKSSKSKEYKTKHRNKDKTAADDKKVKKKKSKSKQALENGDDDGLENFLKSSAYDCL